MSDDDKGKFNPLSGMPPWAWVLLLGSGSGISLGGLSLMDQEEGECPGEDELTVAVARAQAAEASHRAMIDSLQSMALLLGECQTTRNEHGIDIR
tara:strand:- start:376 stop:660 length:285 start_codon:yes stop_codon:yes gene_type:complete